jgi:hypothetical protein
MIASCRLDGPSFALPLRSRIQHFANRAHQILLLEGFLDNRLGAGKLTLVDGVARYNDHLSVRALLEQKR